MVEIATLEKELSDLGVAREKAAARRQGIFGELRQLSIRAEAGDRKALYAQAPLNKDVEDLTREIISIDREIKDKTRQADLCRAASAAHASAIAAAQPGPDKNRWFLVVCPDGREVRHRHHSGAALQAELQPGYRAVAELYNCDDSGNYGVAVALGQRDAVLKHCQGLSA
jgi:hypothetical protein